MAKRKTYTIGRLFTSPDPSEGGEGLRGKNDKVAPSAGTPPLRGGLEGFLCDTLEPAWRDYAHGGRKIKGRSAIPEGRYAVVITWSPKMRQWLPLLIGNEDFRRQWSGVRIHAGNTAADTEGCILVGENRKKGMVVNSRIWLHRLKQRIVEAKGRGEAVWLTVR